MAETKKTTNETKKATTTAKGARGKRAEALGETPKITHNCAVATFEKVSFEQYEKDFRDTYGEDFDRVQIKDIYDAIKLPQRATKGSAGYDFFAPQNINLAPFGVAKIPTGIRVKIDSGWFLGIVPRSGLGFKYKAQLYNTLGVIDSDYYSSSNEGHIFIKITNGNHENNAFSVKRGDGFAQGIFLMYGITTDDDTDGIRDGGFGSTTGK